MDCIPLPYRNSYNQKLSGISIPQSQARAHAQSRVQSHAHAHAQFHAHALSNKYRTGLSNYIYDRVL